MTTTKILTATALMSLLLIGAKVYTAVREYKKDATITSSVLDLVQDELAQELLEDGTFVETESAPSLVSGSIAINRAPTEEKRHRRLPRSKPQKRQYMNALVCEIKSKVGTLIDREANRMIVRRLARGLMETHGLRPTHQASILPMVVEMCLIPSSVELDAKQFGERKYASNRKHWKADGWLGWMLGVKPQSSNL